jgi:glycosyltransferase involved in cell wall biosynthesis
MACSMKKYKGIHEFISLAKTLPNVNFNLILNTNKPDIDSYFENETLPINLSIYPATNNLHPFYNNADVVMNLSRPDEWVETFGMTILEAMYYSKPVIVPPVGGVTELVDDAVNGYHISSYNIDLIKHRLQELSSNNILCKNLGVQSKSKTNLFSIQSFKQSTITLLNRFIY